MGHMGRGLALALLVFTAPPAAATTYTVTNTSDADPGSLRDAILQANANPPGPHRIVFSIPGVGVQTIHLLSDLPLINNPTALDATTQPGYNNVPLIEIDGTPCNNGLYLSADHSSVRGFVINRCQGSGVSVAGAGCSVSACYLGTNSTGTAPSPNAGFGVYVTGDNAMIGGRLPTDRNVISGNGFMGLALNSALRDTATNNYIGTDPTGTVAVPNADYGMEAGATRQAVIDNNLVSGNTGYGIYVDSATPPAPADGALVTRNLVGTDVSGQHALPNASEGIELLSAYTTVGGVGRGNVISGNGDYGIYGSGAFFPSFNQILANKIGVTADGTRPLGNASGGIYLSQSSNNIIGVSRGDGSGNLIAANGGPGIEIDDTTSTNNTIQGNAIGTSFNGALTLANAGAGIVLKSNLATIGASGLAGNIIANNAGGVYVSGVQDKIEGNAIFQNGPGLGIDLLAPNTGVTLNDSLDLDGGANRLQNFPVLQDVSEQFGSQVQLVGQLSSTPNSHFTIDFYSNRQCGAAGYGEGESWAGQLGADTDGTGNIGFVTLIPLANVVGYTFTCTATDAAGNTSEFSPCKSMSEPTAVPAPAGPPTFAFAPPLPSPTRRSTALTYSLAHASHVSLRAYDVAGRKVADLFEGVLGAGPHTVEWNVAEIGSGVYLCRLEAVSSEPSGGRETATRSVIVLH